MRAGRGEKGWKPRKEAKVGPRSAPACMHALPARHLSPLLTLLSRMFILPPQDAKEAEETAKAEAEAKKKAEEEQAKEEKEAAGEGGHAWAALLAVRGCSRLLGAGPRLPLWFDLTCMAGLRVLRLACPLASPFLPVLITPGCCPCPACSVSTCRGV